MQHILIHKNVLVNAILCLSITCTASQAWANDASESKPLELRRIMQELGKNMQTVTDGISREDWALVAKTAPRIADHSKPPFSEKLRILSFVGSEVGKYRDYDKQTYDVAQAIGQAARQQDGQMVIAAFARLQNSCLACHQSFRKPFVEHFYGQH